ncbi:phage antirepressor N-terminal domain-containing protein [Ahrensia marina]|uniref:phage antirepressor N-terminal domain-containing protein n=1 Tax=Ahrensia marina TaxID=1514904 RepID=UPI0035CF23AF
MTKHTQVQGLVANSVKFGQAVEVRTFQFDGDFLPTFEHEGEPWVAMRPLVDALGMSWGSQRERLQSQAGKFNCTGIGTVGADGKQRAMLSIPAAKLPLWLASINPNKIKDKERKEKVERYQEQSAIALHDFWTKGVAVHPDVKDDYAGLVTDVDPKVMQAFGGVMKAVVGKALHEVVPALVAQQIGEQEYGLVRGVTAYEVGNMAGVSDRKGLRGLGGFITHRLRRYHAKKGVTVKMKDLYGPVSVYVYDKPTSKEWLADGGKAEIMAYIEEKRGQGNLRLVGT